MKHKLTETKIFKSNRSLISTIPNTIIELESLTNKDKIRWNYEIINNKHIYSIEFIKDSETSSDNIDEPTEKSDSAATSTEKKIEYSTESENKIYTIEILHNPHKQLKVINKETKKQVGYPITFRKIEDKKDEIISKLKKIETDAEAEEILSKYRK